MSDKELREILRYACGCGESQDGDFDQAIEAIKKDYVPLKAYDVLDGGFAKLQKEYDKQSAELKALKEENK